MMSDPLISVLVPAYNRADTLERCVRSALDSGYPALQIVISDNGSTDDTLAIARRLANADPRIEVVAHPTNLGPLPNWRSCLDRARGDLVHWLWSDDWIEPKFYRTLIDGMARRHAQMAVSAVRVTNLDANWSFIHHSMPDVPMTGDEFLAIHLQGARTPVSPAAALLPLSACRNHFHDAIPRAGTIDCNRRAIGCDALLIAGAALESERVFVHPEPLACFRSHAGSITVMIDGGRMVAHYAWARLWWGRRHGICRSLLTKDLLQLLRTRHVVGFLYGLLLWLKPSAKTAS